ncbi:hypothetical protein [Oleiharenicola sp. Vm1]
MTLNEGNHLIECEALEIEGRWTPFAALPVVVDATLPSAELTTPAPAALA